MHFGLVLLVSTFQHTMLSLLIEYIGVFIQVFMDNIINFSQSVEEHYCYLFLVFKKCQEVNLHLRQEKCYFTCKVVKYLNHMVSSKGVHPNKKNVEMFSAMTRLVDRKGVHYVL